MRGRKRKRALLFELQGGICCHCRQPMKPKHATLEHIIPQSMGGTMAWSNLLVAHKWCNERRGTGKIWRRAKGLHAHVVEELVAKGLCQ